MADEENDGAFQVVFVRQCCWVRVRTSWYADIGTQRRREGQLGDVALADAVFGYVIKVKARDGPKTLS